VTIRRFIAVALAAVVVMGAACAKEDSGGSAPSGDDSSATSTYSENDVSFEYPSDWEEFPAEAAAASTGSNELWNTTFGPDKTNLVNITAYGLNIEVTEDNVETIEGELDRVIQGVVSEAGGEIADGPTKTTIAGFPAYTYEWQGVEVDGDEKDSNAYFLFAGKTEYFFNCQFSDDTADDVLDGCNQILNSFEVAEPSE